MYLLLILLFTGIVLSLDEVTPSAGFSCSRDETCATKNSCDFWVEKEKIVKNLPRSSSQFRQFLSEARAAICNRGRNALCCPQVVKCDNLVEKDPSPGSYCDSGEVCATKSSCLYWENREKSVKNLPRSDSRFKQYVSSARGAICNRVEKALCCPLDDDFDTSSEETVSSTPLDVTKVNGTEIKCGSLLGSTQFASSGSGRSHSAPWAVSIGKFPCVCTEVLSF